MPRSRLRVSHKAYPGEFAHIPDSVFSKPLSRRMAEKLSKQHGVSCTDLLSESCHPRGKRLFHMSRLVPTRLSLEELMHGDLRRIAAERGIRVERLYNMRCLTRWRRKKRLATSCSRSPESDTALLSFSSADAGDDNWEAPDGLSADRNELPTPHAESPVVPSSPTSSAFSFDVAAAATAGEATLPCVLSFILSQALRAGHSVPSLCILASVAEESRSALRDNDPVGAPPALTARLEVLPLPVLRDLAATLSDARNTVETECLPRQEDAVAEAVAAFAQEQYNVLLYNVCLWQRRHPLGVAAFVLEMYRTGQLSEYVRAGQQQEGPRRPHVALGLRMPSPPVAVMDDMMEALTNSIHPQLARIPPLIRCDVLMTYPHMPVEEQLAMMAEVSDYVKRERQLCGRNSAANELQETSERPVSPHVLLHNYLPEAAIPDRMAIGITDAQYRTIRQAVERHKRDGVRRLCKRSYS